MIESGVTAALEKLGLKKSAKEDDAEKKDRQDAPASSVDRGRTAGSSNFTDLDSPEVKMAKATLGDKAKGIEPRKVSLGERFLWEVQEGNQGRKANNDDVPWYTRFARWTFSLFNKALDYQTDGQISMDGSIRDNIQTVLEHKSSNPSAVRRKV